MLLEKCKISGFADEIHPDILVQVQVLCEIEQNYIEFRSACGKGVADYSIDEIKEVKKILQGSNIKVSAIGSPIGKISITDDFEPHFETFKHVIKLAKELDTRYIRLFSFFIPKGEEPSIYKDEVISRMQRLIDYAVLHDVVLLHENEKDIYGDTAIRCLELMKSFYCDNFKCIFDFANFIQCDVDTREAYELLKPYIYYVHIKDAKSDTKEVVLPGQGDGRLLEIFKLLDEENYQGFLSLEPHLVQFSGLNKLERQVKERTLTDGVKAYRMAHQELIKILEQNSR